MWKNSPDFLAEESISLSELSLSHLQSFAAALHDLGISARSQAHPVGSEIILLGFYTRSIFWPPIRRSCSKLQA